MAQISIIGSGYVGLVYGAAFADLGNDVVGVDINVEKVRALQQGACPIYEPGLPEVLQRNLSAGRLRFTTDYADAVPQSEFIFICVDTPSSSSGEADMRQVRSAATMTGQHIRSGAIVVNKSTMPIGSGDLVTSLIAEQAPVGTEFHVISNPEFLREGAAMRDVFSPDRIVLGTDSEAAAARVKELYRALNAPVVVTDRRTAEMIKYASNSFLATKISFINEMALICERVGADVTVVAEGMGHDARIGPLFLQAGVGYGGSCFPKDVKALAHMAHEADCHPQLLHAVMEINQDQRRRFVHKVQQHLGGDLHAKEIAVWGLAFKQDTDDMRESPSVDIVQMLLQRGATVRAYDPVAGDNAARLLPSITIASNPYDAVQGADALCLVTPWNEFKQANLTRVAELMRNPLLLDGRNLYDSAEIEALGFTYVGVGR